MDVDREKMNGDMADKKNKAIGENVGTERAVIDVRTVWNKIYDVCGVQVIVDYELAKVYWYETESISWQVKNNAEKFEGEVFMFWLMKAEFGEI